MAAEWPRYRRDDSDFPNTVVEGITACGFANVISWQLSQWLPCRERLHDLIKCDNDLRAPDAVFLERHELDEANDDTFIPRKLCELDDLIFIETAQQHTIHFHRIETNFPCRTNSGK